MKKLLVTLFLSMPLWGQNIDISRIRFSTGTYAPASALGSMDANLATGLSITGGVATDNTTVINNFLASGSSLIPKTLFLDGATVHSGIRLPLGRNINIVGCGLTCGFFSKAGTDTFAISNATPTTGPWVPFDPGQFPPFNVTPSLTNYTSYTISDLFINANGGLGDACTGVISCALTSAGEPYTSGKAKGYVTNSPTGTSVIGTAAFPSSPTLGQWAIITNGTSATSCSRAGASRVACFWNGSAWTPGGNGSAGSFAWFTGIDLSNVNYVRLKNVRVKDSPTYAARFTNVNTVVVEDFICDGNASSTNNNHDCVHVSGPAENVTVRGGVYSNIDDDTIAANATEGYGGTISNFTVDGPQFVDVHDGVNILGDVQTSILTNMQGTVKNGVVRIIGTGVGTVDISNSVISYTSPGVSTFVNGIMSSMTKLTVSNVTAIGPTGNSNQGQIFCYNAAGAATIGEIEINNLTMAMTVAQHGAIVPLLNIETGCAVQKVTINGMQITNPSGSSYAANSAININGTINELVINSLNPRYMTALMSGSGWSNVTRVSGSGLLAMGFTVPDAIVVNGVPYISATTGLASIKVGGTANGINGTVTTLANYQRLTGSRIAFAGNEIQFGLQGNDSAVIWQQGGTEIAASVTGAQVFETGTFGFGIANTKCFAWLTYQTSVDGCLAWTPGTKTATLGSTSGGSDGILKLAAVTGGGYTPSVGTCGTIGAGSSNIAGFITSGTTGTCTSVLTFSGVTATTGWSCGISNSTTANLIRQTGSSTTTATFEGTTVSGDVLRYACSAY